MMKMKSVRCPNCGAIRFKPDGMCCNSGKDSGYQYYCRKCGVWFVQTFDGRILIDEFLMGSDRK
jgi:DNA-directed RNA polymerase subunit RPC12/RpoP